MHGLSSPRKRPRMVIQPPQYLVFGANPVPWGLFVSRWKDYVQLRYGLYPDATDLHEMKILLFLSVGGPGADDLQNYGPATLAFSNRVSLDSYLEVLGLIIHRRPSMWPPVPSGIPMDHCGPSSDTSAETSGRDTADHCGSNKRQDST